MPPLVAFEQYFTDIVIEVFEDAEPVAAANFLNLVKGKFYDGLTLHNIQPGYAAHFGCPFTRIRKDEDKSTADQYRALRGCGGPEPHSKFTDSLGNEHVRDAAGKIPAVFNSKKSNKKFTVAMSHDGDGKFGSQIFFNLRDNTQLDWFNTNCPDKHVVIGEVITGDEFLTDICKNHGWEPVFLRVKRRK